MDYIFNYFFRFRNIDLDSSGVHRLYAMHRAIHKGIALRLPVPILSKVATFERIYFKFLASLRLSS